MELFDIYDDDRNLTGRTAERNQKLKGGEHQLIVHVNIMNTESSSRKGHRRARANGGKSRQQSRSNVQCRPSKVCK